METLEHIIQRHNHICWYPSAGSDFRVLLFLSEQYCRWKKVDIDTGSLPDLFILTDCNPQYFQYNKRTGCSDIAALNAGNTEHIKVLYSSSDRETVITVDQLMFVENINIQPDNALFSLTYSSNIGNVYYMKVHIKSAQLGDWNTEIIYIFTENTGFALKYLIPMKLSIDYIVRVRYGDVFGGSALQGEWLLKLLKPLNVRYFLSNEINATSFSYVPEQLSANYSSLRELWGCTDTIPLQEVFCVDGKSWSDQGDIHWYRTPY